MGERRPRNGNIGNFEKLERADVDVAVVGAGVAGLYVAWRLLLDPAYATKQLEHSEFSFETRGYFLRGKYIPQELSI